MDNKNKKNSRQIDNSVIIGEDVVIGEDVTIMAGCVIGNHVTISDGVYIDFHVIIRDYVVIGKNSYIGANCILGEYIADFFDSYKKQKLFLMVDDEAIIRSGSILYAGTKIGKKFQTGHHITIRENTEIGDYVSVGTLSDIQGNCEIGNYVRMHSNVHIGQKSKVSDFVWIFPYVVLTNDPTPPSEELEGVVLKSFAVIATGSILLPGIVVEEDTLIAAGAIVTKDVHQGEVVGGNPAKVISNINNIKSHITGLNVYPWRYNFKRGMPWEDSDYQTWYEKISKEIEKEKEQNINEDIN